MLYILDFYCIAFTFRDIKNPWPCALTLSAPCLVDLHSHQILRRTIQNVLAETLS